MLIKHIFLTLFLMAQMCGNQANTHNKQIPNNGTELFPYDLSNPSATFNLEASLGEISGLTATEKDGQLGCLQDESGQLFHLDTQTGKATPSVIFQNSGDFEGIEFVADTLWATTSKGKLFKVWHLDKTPFDTQILKIESLKKANIEGLAYDKKNNRLLLCSKGDKADGTLLRTIWAFDLQKQDPSVTKAFDIQLIDFQAFLTGKTGKEYEKLIKDYVEKPLETGFDYGPSGIAVHPLNGHIYIVSSINKILVVLNAEGKILEMVKLDKNRFPQPEGLCFDGTGTLFISNEAKDNGAASLLVFQIQKK